MGKISQLTNQQNFLHMNIYYVQKLACEKNRYLWEKFSNLTP